MLNPIQFLKTAMSGQASPQQIVNQLLTDTPNPMLNNLVKMAQSGDKKGIENFARNFYKEQGRDFDKEYAEFMESIKQSK